MATNPLVELTMAAAQLKGAAPVAFDKLCNALRSYEIQAITEILSTTETADLFRCQGKVKTVQQLRKHFSECFELRDTYARRDTNGRPDPVSIQRPAP